MVRFGMSALVVFGMYLLIHSVTSAYLVAFGYQVQYALLIGLACGGITYGKMRK